MKTRKVVNVLTENKNTNVIVGAEVYISVEHAREFYKMTNMQEGEITFDRSNDGKVIVDTNTFDNLLKVRSVLREISKSILITNGETMSAQSFIESLSSNVESKGRPTITMDDNYSPAH